MPNPLLSVIIPTYGRPSYLNRAVDSALCDMASYDVEVLVIPNGPDDSWRGPLEKYRDIPSIHVYPISIAHANVARNIGLKQATGTYIRFLDDDDYLIAGNADKQIQLLEQTGAEICSGLIENVDSDLSSLGILSFPETQDFVSAVLTLSGFRLPVGNLFRRETLITTGAKWREDLPRAQDLMWMIDLAKQREWKWVHFPKPVGVWFQHEGDRLSTVKPRNDKPIQIINALFDLYEKLDKNQRLTTERLETLSSLLWNYIHWRFPYDMIYWTKVAHRTLRIAPDSRPDHAIFENAWLKHANPLLAELILAFPRKVSTLLRETKRNLTGWDYRRRL
ncbi:glycosyltransferase family 2 protein [Desulfosediminicola flagellatus]|uniref:glycosyltransferase family 2 protein n=1 Tax=Desulfosediminicola flagellatus TaxID=2569541 RepID=UPI0010AD5B72|nr:glycosyltransferase family 2 protein [Desulfosediminicola flagellatus]